MAQKILYFVLGLLYSIAGYLGFFLLFRARLDFPHFIIYSTILFLLVPIILTLILWKQKRMLSIGLIISLILMLPILSFIAPPYDIFYDIEGNYVITYHLGPGMYFYYKSSVKRWFATP